MSLPERMPTCRSAIALVRVNRGIDVDDLAPALLRLHHPAESHRVTLGEVRAHDDDAVGVLQVLLERRCAASTE